MIPGLTINDRYQTCSCWLARHGQVRIHSLNPQAAPAGIAPRNLPRTHPNQLPHPHCAIKRLCTRLTLTSPAPLP